MRQKHIQDDTNDGLVSKSAESEANHHTISVKSKLLGLSVTRDIKHSGHLPHNLEKRGTRRSVTDIMLIVSKR